MSNSFVPMMPFEAVARNSHRFTRLHVSSVVEQERTAQNHHDTSRHKQLQNPTWLLFSYGKLKKNNQSVYPDFQQQTNIKYVLNAWALKNEQDSCARYAVILFTQLFDKCNVYIIHVYIYIHYIHVYFQSSVQLQTKQTLESKYAILKFKGIL